MKDNAKYNSCAMSDGYQNSFSFFTAVKQEKTRLDSGEQNLDIRSPHTKMWVKRAQDLFWSLTILDLKSNLDNY